MQTAPRAPHAEPGPLSLHEEGDWDSKDDFRELCFSQLELLLHDILRCVCVSATKKLLTVQSCQHEPILASSHAQMQRYACLFRQPHWQATVFARVPETFSSGRLELQRIATAGATTLERREGTLLLSSGTAILLHWLPLPAAPHPPE